MVKQLNGKTSVKLVISFDLLSLELLNWVRSQQTVIEYRLLQNVLFFCVNKGNISFNTVSRPTWRHLFDLIEIFLSVQTEWALNYIKFITKNNQFHYYIKVCVGITRHASGLSAEWTYNFSLILRLRTGQAQAQASNNGLLLVMTTKPDFQTCQGVPSPINTDLQKVGFTGSTKPTFFCSFFLPFFWAKLWALHVKIQITT